MDSRDMQVISDLKSRKKPAAFKPFPIYAMPEPVMTYIKAGAKALGCDTSYIALPMLSALASAIGNSRRIKLKDSWSEPPIIWTAIVGDSGTRKSPAVELVLKPLRRKQDEAFKEYAEKLKEYEVELQDYELAVKQRKKNDPLPDKPIEPIGMRYCCDDVTIEAMASLLKNSPRGLLLARDELAGWLKSFNAYKAGKGGDDSKWLELFRAGTLLVDRKTGTPKTIHIPNASVGVCGGIQPGILQAALGREHFENGLAARLLLTMPPRKANTWTEADVDQQLQVQIEGVFENLLALNMEEDECGNLKPVHLPLTPSGRKAWITFYNEHAAEQAELTGGDMAAVMSKLEGYCARFALVVHCTRVAVGDQTVLNDNCIDQTSVECAMDITRWFAEEIKRIYETLGEDDDQQDQRRLLELIQAKDGKITVRELMRSGRTYQSSQAARNALQQLADIGWGKFESVPAGAGGGRPSEVFVLIENNSDDKTPAEELQ